MCFLCMRPLYPDLDFRLKEKALVLARAQALKIEIQKHEEVVRAAVEQGNTPCPNTLARLAQMRTEQYEIAQKI